MVLQLHTASVTSRCGTSVAHSFPPEQLWDFSCTQPLSQTPVGFQLHTASLTNSCGTSCIQPLSQTPVGFQLHTASLPNSCGASSSHSFSPEQMWDFSCIQLLSRTAVGLQLHRASLCSSKLSYPSNKRWSAPLYACVLATKHKQHQVCLLVTANDLGSWSGSWL